MAAARARLRACSVRPCVCDLFALVVVRGACAAQGALDDVRADHDAHAALLAQAAGDGARLQHLLDRSRADAQAADHAVRVRLGV